MEGGGGQKKRKKVGVNKIATPLFQRQKLYEQNRHFLWSFCDFLMGQFVLEPAGIYFETINKLHEKKS